MNTRFTFIGVAVAAMFAATFVLLSGHLRARAALEPFVQDQPQGPIYELQPLSGATGAKRVIGIPEFSAAGATSEIQEAAKITGSVLWDDINFEHEYTLVSRDAAAKVPVATSPESLDYDRWSELGADYVMLGSVRSAPTGTTVEIRVFGIRGELARRQLFGKAYGCQVKNARSCAHFISDDFYKSVGITGVARTHIAFVSDRADEAVQERVVQNRAQEVYIADYDGENVRRVTAQRRVNISPSWSPDGRLLAYTAWAPAPDIFVQHIYEVARPTRPAAGNDDVQSAHAAWSPDGTRLAFSSKRGGAKNYNIYVVNRDGTNLRQLTTGESGDVAPTWSPSGGQIAYVSGRTGKAQLYLIGADGTNNQRLSCQEAECDHPSWSAVVNKIAYSCGSSGAGYDICLLDMGSRTIAKLTDGSGSNEQPSFAPNGRHVLFVTTRWGKKQLATVDVTGTNLKRLTTTGNNNYPDWSHAAQ